MRHHSVLILASLLAVVTANGCAGYKITPAGTGLGYDVYRPQPYILVTFEETKADKETKVEAKGTLLWLPDMTARYRVKTWNHFGKADFEFKFDDGWRLSSVADKSDNTAIAKELIGVAKELGLKAMTGGAAALEPGEKAPPPQQPLEPILYQVAYDGSGAVTGLHRMSPNEARSTAPPPPDETFEWPGVVGGLSWIFGFGSDSY